MLNPSNNNKELKDLKEKVKGLIFFRNVIVLLLAASLTLIYINRTGSYPWGSDTFGHLFKGNILSDNLSKGKFFLNYIGSWYNGIQPFRYWAPLPYYILAFINVLVNNIITTFNLYIVFIFILGGLGWLCWGYYLDKQRLGLIIAILWFFVPDNLRVLFSEGNLPFVLVNALIPFVFLYYYKSVCESESERESQRENRIRNYLILALLMGTITLTHAMLAAMVGLSLFILWFVQVVIHKGNLKSILSLVYAFLGIMVTSFWLYPALRGGIISIDQSAVREVMESLTHNLSYSLNPFLRFSNIEGYYYGLAFGGVAVIGLLFSTKNERAPFAAALIILFGTTKLALPLLVQLPMNELFWMERFTGISMAFILLALLSWKTLRRSILILLISFLTIDSGISFYLLGHNGKAYGALSKIIDIAANVSTQRIAVLDSSSFGSYPSYYINYNSVNGDQGQVYGWAWQGAATAKNIVMINTALENGYYGLMFDRALELGADTLIVRKELMKDLSNLYSEALAVGYNKYYEDNIVIIFKYPVKGKFGTIVSFKGIAIGSYGPNIPNLFPEIQTGTSNYIDDYSYEELLGKKVIYLSGFDYSNKKSAEDLILRLSKNGVRIVIDMEGQTESFLGVSPQPIILNKNYKDIFYKGQKLKIPDFPEALKLWKTCFLNGIENKDSYAIADYRLINYIGTKYNENLTFLGLNLPYFAFMTKDSGAVRILEEAFNMKAYTLPKRIVQGLDIKVDDNVISIKSSVPNVLVPIASLDAFIKITGDYKVENNLIHLKTPELKVKIIYPYLKTGTEISALFLFLIIVLSSLLLVNKRTRERRKKYKHRFRNHV